MARELTPPPCYVAGQDSCNCAAFATQSSARWFMDAFDPDNRNRLDGDSDGLPCEHLPG